VRAKQPARQRPPSAQLFIPVKNPSIIIAAMAFLYILIGLIVGVFSGIVGIGGGIIIVPALVYIFHMSQHRAQGTSLAVLLAPVGLLAFWEYHKAGNVDVSAALLIALGFFMGGYFGGLWAQQLPEIALRRVFGTLLVMIGIRLLLGR
jgi:uncharacterized membrane protein YfcA